MLEWEAYFEPHILERGISYARNGAVQFISKQGDMIEAIVAGSEYYKVKLRFDGNILYDSYCSCPYAGRGNTCKHMAAVLCAAEASNVNPYIQRDGESRYFDDLTKIPIEELIYAADRNQLEKILVKLASTDEKTESHIRAALAGSSLPLETSDMKKEIDSIFFSYSGQGGYIDYHAAIGFEHDLITYLENETNRLFNDGNYYAAFEIAKYAYVKLGNWDIDDDGEIAAISNCCYEIWQKAVWNCSDFERNQIREWFIEHSDDGTVIDFMEEMLQEFLRYELASKEELQEEIRYLDKLIEESKGLTKCKSVFTCFYGYTIEAIEFRIILMERLGADEQEIDAFRQKHLWFQSVRKYYIDQAKAAGNTEEEIRLLNESKRLDADSSYLLHSYSKRLIELYHLENNHTQEKAERISDFMAYQSAEIEDFRTLRKMYSVEEWKKERVELIKSRTDVDKRCLLMAEERMIPELYGLISEQEEKLHLFNKYGFLLVQDYSEPILQEYCKYVSSLADYARNRASYDELKRYLMRMQQYNGGSDLVRTLCKEWINKYPTRKVMVQELRTMLGSLLTSG